MVWRGSIGFDEHMDLERTSLEGEYVDLDEERDFEALWVQDEHIEIVSQQMELIMVLK